MNHKINLIVSYIAVALFSGSAFAAAQPTATPLTTTAPAEKLPLADLERFTTVMEHIKNYYVICLSYSIRGEIYCTIKQLFY